MIAFFAEDWLDIGDQELSRVRSIYVPDQDFESCSGDEGSLGFDPPDENTLSTHPTYLTSESEAEPFSLNIPVQNAMIPVISHLVPQYQQASTWEWELKFRTITPLGLLEPHDPGGTQREGTHSTSKKV